MSKSTDWIPALWLKIFDDLLSNYSELDYGDQWTLTFNYSQTDSLTPKERKEGWKVNCQHVTGKFQCGSCFRTWFSGKVLVLFRYRLRGHRGTVIMRPFCQICRQCNSNVFNRPGFLEKDIENSLLRLFSKIRKNCYGDKEDDSQERSSYRMTKPHEKTLCEACHLGMCSEVNE